MPNWSGSTSTGFTPWPSATWAIRTLAEDVVQSVFVLLARKARDLRPGTLLGGWLFRTTRHVAGHARRAEQRRKIREATACTMSHDTTSPDTDEILWQQLAPHLDQAVAALSEADRSAILLRFYEKMPLREVGERLGVSEEAAKKRVSRAWKRCGSFWTGAGSSSAGSSLAAVLAEKTVQTASAALAGAVVKISMAAASASASAMLPPLARETLRAWQWAKIKLAAGFGAGSLALIFVAVIASGLLTRHASSPSVSANNSPGAEDTAMATGQLADAFSAPAVSGKTQTPPKTGAITGLVVDEKGHPIRDAKVWGGLELSTFCAGFHRSIRPVRLGQDCLTAVRDGGGGGYAADQQEFDPTNVAGPLVFRLSLVRPLMVRLVNESGEGVAGVELFLQQWWGNAGTLGWYLPQQTDAGGRLQWLSPPKGGLELCFAKSGYRYSRTNKFAADGQEHVIVLHPTATVTGRVTDAETGAPVDNFKFTLGHSQPWAPDDEKPIWNLRSQTATNGTYAAVIEEEQVPYLRVEADGYDTVEAMVQLTNEFGGVGNFQLRPKSAANSIRGVVLLPDGTPAAGVEVALCTTQVGVMLNGTAFEPGAFGNVRPSAASDYRRRTDEQGFFSFDPKPGAHTVVAVGQAGLGQVHCLDFSNSLEIRLQPWGRIEGTVRTYDGQWVDRKIKWQQTGRLTSWMTLYYASEGCSARSDANGNFTLEHVPPGDGRVAIDDDAGAAPILSAAIEVNPGETARVQIGGVGRQVTGRLVAPTGVEIRNWSNQVTFAQLTREWDPYPMPDDLTGNAADQWKLEFADTEAGRAWLRDQCAYDFKVGADGSFSIPEVLPGKYRLFVSVVQGSLGSGSDSTARDARDPQIASAGMKLAVPDGSGDNAPVDLGDIILAATH